MRRSRLWYESPLTKLYATACPLASIKPTVRLRLRAIVIVESVTSLIVTALAIPETEKEAHYTLAKASDACNYCDYPAICGKAWEAVR